MNLLQTKARAKIAKEGVNLLKSKRDALIQEFFSFVKMMLDDRAELDLLIENAAQVFYKALGLDGPEIMDSVGFAAHREIDVEVRWKNLWGIKIPELHKQSLVRSMLERGYSIITVSSRVDESAAAFEQILDKVLSMADNETRVKRMGEEIKKTTRRVNALEQVVIPGLVQQKTFIQAALTEREREDLYRLKRFKKNLETRAMAKIRAQRSATETPKV